MARHHSRDKKPELRHIYSSSRSASKRSRSEQGLTGTWETAGLQSTEVPLTEDALFQGADFAGPPFSFDNVPPFSFQDPTTSFSEENSNEQSQEGPPLNELMDLGGIFESLPPFEVMEDL